MRELVGIILALIGNATIGLSFVLKKIALLRRRADQNVMTIPLWWCGVALMAGGEIGNFLAYGWASAAVISPLGAVSVLVNYALARAVLGERLSKVGTLGCVLCLLGTTILVVLFPDSQGGGDDDGADIYVLDDNENTANAAAVAANNSNAAADGPATIRRVADLWPYISAPAFLLYLAALLATTFVLAMAARNAEKQRRKAPVLVFIGVCATLGSLTVLSCRGVSVAVANTVAGRNDFDSLLPFLLVGVASAQVATFLCRVAPFLGAQHDTYDQLLFCVALWRAT
jgi:drug/metabolite transporter (DMT)-like permease